MGETWRKKLSQLYQLTYSSTIHHLVNGLRKLTRLNCELSHTQVYRGIRGELPEAFWLKDSLGFVTATDFSFMSTTPDLEVCKEYMSPKGANLLWEIRCGPETSEGFHSGADVSMLSQFPDEREILFPPMTMLTVVTGEGVNGEHDRGVNQVYRTKPDGPEIQCLKVVVSPSFA